jgi:hypothetical protein
VETANSQPNRILAAVGLLVLVGWAWSLSNVGIPDVVWLANAALTIVFLVLLALAGVRLLRRA